MGKERNRHMRAFPVAMAAVALCLGVIGCRYIGGGVAGASFDPIWRVNSANQYTETVAGDRITVSVSPRTGERPPQLFGEIMRCFPINVERVEKTWTSIPNSSSDARYRRYRFELRSGSSILISEKLPKVFNMHPVRLGMGTVGTQSVIMIVNKSRSSTGLYFVALYTLQGEPLYKSVLGTGQVWDIRITDNGIDILGHSEVRHILMQSTAEPEN